MLHEGLLERYDGLGDGAQTLVRVLVVFAFAYLVLWLLRRYAVVVMERSPRADRTLIGFLGKLITTGGWIVLVAVVLVTAGVDLAAMLGGLAIGGFIIGFALKDTLGNLAAGVVLLVYRPFDLGDTVTIDGHAASVIALGMALTHLEAADGRIITVPNGKVLGGSIINHTRKDRRRADVTLGISYDADIDAAVRSILAALQKDPRVLAEPAPGVRVTALGDSAVGLQVRPWVKTADLWQAQADFHGIVKKALDDEKIGIPYPQMDVRVK